MRKLKWFAWSGETNIWIFSPPQAKSWHGRGSYSHSAHLMQPFFCIEPLPPQKNNVPYCIIWQENLSILYFRTPNQPPPHWQQKKRKIIITVTNWSNSFFKSHFWSAWLIKISIYGWICNSIFKLASLIQYNILLGFQFVLMIVIVCSKAVFDWYH